MDLMTFLSLGNMTFRFLSVAGCICLFQRLLSVQSSRCFKTVPVWSQFLAIMLIALVCACRSSSAGETSEVLRPLLNVHFLTLFLLNSYHHPFSLVLLHTVFSCFSSQGPRIGLDGELYHSNFNTQTKKKFKKNPTKIKTNKNKNQPKKLKRREMQTSLGSLRIGFFSWAFIQMSSFFKWACIYDTFYICFGFIFFKIRGSNSDVLYGMKIWGLCYEFTLIRGDRQCLQLRCQALKRPF